MPFYNWSGIDLLGIQRVGSDFAISELDLDNKLFSKNICLISCKIKTHFLPKITNSEIFSILSQLSELLNAEIRLYQAILIIKSSIKNKHLLRIISSVADDIHAGLNLSRSISHHNIFDELTKAIIISGENTGNLKHGLYLLIQHEQAIKKFNQDIKSNLLMPFLTLGLFLLIAAGLIIFIVPKFEVLYQSFKEPLPDITIFILNISRKLRSISFLLGSFTIIISTFILTKLLGKRFKHWKDRLVLKIPYIGPFLLLIYQAKFLSVFSLMLQGKVHIIDSIKISSKLFTNSCITEEIEKIYNNINSGKPLNKSIEKTVFNSDQLHSLILIGESSGDLASIIDHCSKLHQQKVYKYISKLTIILGPLLITLTGLLIGCLILALYIPILNLSNVIQ